MNKTIMYKETINTLKELKAEAKANGDGKEVERIDKQIEAIRQKLIDALM